MKHLIISTLFTLLLPLAACTEKDISGGEPPHGPQTGLRLSARLSQGVATRALGDPFAAKLEEKRIDRLAFFVHTKEDGFQVYPPVPDDVTDPDIAAADHPNAVYLAGTPADGYTATVALTAGGGYVADIIAIANLPADYDYRQIVSWQGLQDTVAILATKMPACLPGSAETDLSKRNAFVMYGDVTKELKKEENNTLSFSLSRLVARIDITNEAYEAGTTPDNAAASAGNGFFLTSARLLRAMPAAYLVPKPDETPDVVTVAWPALTGIGTDILYGKPTDKTVAEDPTQEPQPVDVAGGGNANDATLQYLWHTIYTYPNEDTDHAPTALEVKGTFRGTEITRQIPFIDKKGDPFPLLGNYRYLVRIQRAPGQTDITFDIKVSEWDAVDTVNVKPDQSEVPVVSNMVTNAAKYVNSDGETVYDLYYTQDGEMTFDATCRFASGVRVKYYDNKTGNWTTDGDWLKVEQTGEEVVPVTKADNTYKRSYKVSYAKFSTGLTRKAMLLVHNGGSEVECDTILIRHTLTYPGTDFEPVAVGYRSTDNSEVIWAPVNVGATALGYDDIGSVGIYNFNTFPAETQERYLNEAGFHYQWGRNIPFRSAQAHERITLSPDNYLTLEEANDPLYSDKLFKGSSGNNYIKQESFGSEFTNWPARYDPCPEGWHIPDKVECQALVDRANAENLQGKIGGVYILNGNTDGQLYIPIIGFYLLTMNEMMGNGVVLFWSSDYSYSSEQSIYYPATIYLHTKPEVFIGDETVNGTCNAMVIRCAQNKN